MIRVLLIGNASHQHILSFASLLRKECQQKTEIEIDILTHIKVSGSKKDVYDNVIFFNLTPNFLFRIPVLREVLRIVVGYYLQYKKIKKHYNICHIHNLFYYHFFGWGIITKAATKSIISVWGDDYNTVKNLKKIMVNYMLNKTDVVALTNRDLQNKLKNRLKNKHKIISLGYGLSPLKPLIELKKFPKMDSKAYWGIPKNKIVVTCGYSNREEHHQLELIDIIDSYPTEVKKRLFVIFPMTYGNEVENLRLVKKRLEQVSFDFILFEEFLSDKETALLRKASDIFIHVVDHDQNSGAMFEYFYTDNIVIAGSWLPYKGLVEEGFSFEFVDSVQEVKKKLFILLNNFNVKIVPSDFNIKSYIENNRSWDNIIKAWCGLYRNLYES